MSFSIGRLVSTSEDEEARLLGSFCSTDMGTGIGELRSELGRLLSSYVDAYMVDSTSFVGGVPFANLTTGKVSKIALVMP